MSLIKFERVSAPIGSVEFSRNPAPEKIVRRRSFKQPKDFSDGGVLYSYNKGVVSSFEELHFDGNPAIDYTNLMTFINDVVNGNQYSFTYRDYLGNSRTARIYNSDDLQSSPVLPTHEQFSVILYIES